MNLTLQWRHADDRHAVGLEVAREIGPASVEAVSRKLFRERSWGSMAESETYAHLEHLRIAGRAEARRGKDDKLIYTFG